MTRSLAGKMSDAMSQAWTEMRATLVRGFTLVELLMVVAIIGVLAAVAWPMLGSGDAQKLAVAAEETANFLRLAQSEARRTGGYVLVDGKTTSGRLALYQSNSSAQMPPATGTAALLDPLTKNAAVLDVTGSLFSRGVTLTPIFRSGIATSWSQLLIGPGLSQFQAFDGIPNKGPIQINSGVLLSYGGQSLLVRVNEVTGRVTLP